MKRVAFLITLVFVALTCIKAAYSADIEIEKKITIKQYASGSRYVIIKGTYTIFVSKDNNPLEPIKKEIDFNFNIQGRNLFIKIELTPGHPAWKELKDTRAGDTIWAHIGEDGKIFDIRKKDPAEK